MIFVRPQHMTDYEYGLISHEKCPKCNQSAEALVRCTERISERTTYTVTCLNCYHQWNVTFPMAQEATQMTKEDGLEEMTRAAVARLLGMSNNAIKQLKRDELVEYAEIFTMDTNSNKRELADQIIRYIDNNLDALKDYVYGTGQGLTREDHSDTV